jgi:spore germination protein GerM
MHISMFLLPFFSFLLIIPLNSASNTLSKQEGLLDNGIAQNITKITFICTVFAGIEEVLFLVFGKCNCVKF